MKKFFNKKTKLTSEQQKRVEILKKMTPEEWDSLCKKCGACCCMKVYMCLLDIKHSLIFYTDCCCEHLDLNTKKCKNYDTRFENGSVECGKIGLEHVLNKGFLSSSCAYVEYVFGPSKHPVDIDFSKMKPVKDGFLDNLYGIRLLKHILWKSCKWNKR